MSEESIMGRLYREGFGEPLRVTATEVRAALKMAEAVSSRCEEIMMGALRSDGNTVTRATERGLEPVQPRDLWVDPESIMRLENSSPPQEISGLAPNFGRARSLAWYGAMAFNRIANAPERCVFVDTGGEPQETSPITKPSRELRYLQLRGNEQQPLRKLGEINAILEAEGYLEVSGEGVMPCPTKSHEIVRENKGAKRMIEGMPNANI